MTDQPARPASPSDADRRTIFAALAAMMRTDVSEPVGRAEVASRFGVSEHTLLAIEREGIENAWPPLGD